MALFQPSNIIPSSFGGVDETTVDVSANVKISWQVNGNSAMSAFDITIYNNATGDQVGTTHSVTSGYNLPFYGVDNKGNPQQFTYEPTSTTWSSWGLSNGNEYKMIITQYWGTGNANSVTQYSGSVFYTREKPTLTMKYNGNTPIDNAFTVQQATATFGANLSIPTIAINAVRWVIKNSSGAVLDDTGFINTPILSYTYDGLFSGNNGNTYYIECTVETENQVSVTTGVITLNVSYTPAEQSGKLTVDCQVDDSVLVSWNTATNILGKVMEDGEEVAPTISNGYLTLADGQTAEWDKVNDESMSLPNPFTSYSLAWKGEIGAIKNQQYNITATPQTSTETQRMQRTQSDYTIDDIELADYTQNNYFSNSLRDFAVGNGIIVILNTYGSLFISTDNGANWQQNDSCKQSEEIYSGNIVYGLDRFIVTIVPNNSSSSKMWYSYNANNWVEFLSPLNNYYLNTYKIIDVCYGTNNNRFFFLAVRTTTNNGASIYEFQVWRTNYDLTSWMTETTISQSTGSLWRFDSIAAYSISNTTNIFLFGREQGIYKVISGSSIISVYNTYPGTIESISFNNNVLVAVGRVYYNINYYGILAYSTDGNTWQTIKNEYSSSKISQLYSVAFSATTNYFVALGGKSFYYSINGIDWKEKSFDNQSIPNDNAKILYNNNGEWFAINKWYYYNLTGFYTINDIKSESKWLNSWNYTSQSSIRNVIVNSNHSQGTITATVETYEPSLDITITYSLYSNTSYAETPLNLPFTQGTIAGIKELSKTTGATYTNLTFAANSITITGLTIPTPNAQASVTQITLNLAVIYDSQFSSTEQTVISLNSGEYTAQLYTAFTANNLYYKLAFYNNLTLIGSINLEPTIPTTNSSYEILGNIILNAANILLALMGENVSTTSDNADITYTQSAITSVQLVGAQVVDYLYIQKNNITLNNNQTFTPIWNENTLFFANFVEQLQAGTVSATGSYQNAIYRLESGNILKPIITLPTNVLQFKDYGIKSQQVYSYELFYLNSAQESGYSAPVQSAQVCRIFRAYSLIEATEDSQSPNVYHVLKVWRFGNNISAGTISNNNSPNWLTNFTPYRLRQPSSRLGESGTLQALLSNYNQSQNFYNDTAQMMQELKQASVSNNTFFLKDMKGNLYMVGISAPITQTINTKTQLQEVTISVPWEEVGDATNVSLIQTPTDSGWQGNN